MESISYISRLQSWIYSHYSWRILKIIDFYYIEKKMLLLIKTLLILLNNLRIFLQSVGIDR